MCRYQLDLKNTGVDEVGLDAASGKFLLGLTRNTIGLEVQVPKGTLKKQEKS